jgi:hypothetical protein
LQETPFSLHLLLERARVKEFKDARGPAMITALLANVNRDTKKRPEGFSEFDFIPSHLIPANLRKPSKPQYCELTAMQQRRMLASFFGHKVVKGKIVAPPKKVKRKR